MEIIRKNSIAFLRSCAPVSTRIMIKDRKEDFAIVRQDNQHIRLHSCKLDLGNAAVTFLYDSNFEIITSFLLESCEIVAQIKQRENNTEQWSYFNNLLLNLCYGGMMHPMYYPLYTEIVSAYQRDMRGADGEFLPDDYFVRLGQELIEVRDRVSELLCAQDSITDSVDLMGNYYSTAFSESLPIKNLHAEVTSSGELQFILIPNRIEEIWNFLVVVYSYNSIRFKRCENCKRFFATTGRGNPKFCDRIIEGSGKSCRQLMPKANFQSKTEKDPAFWLYNRAYKTIYARIGGGTWTKEMFKEWAVRARVKRDECSGGNISPEEYSAWLCSNGLFIDYLKDD